MNSIRHTAYSFLLAAGSLLASVCPAHADVVIRGRSAAEHSVNLYHAQDLLGMRVMSADGHRVGAIADFVFDFSGRPRLTDVLVRSGPLGWVGYSRIVPITALHRQGDHWQENLTRRDFQAIPPLFDDVDHYLEQNRDLSALDREYHVPARPPQGRFIAYSSLLNTRLIGSNGAHIGLVVDALVNLGQREVFYLGVVPTYDVFQPSEPGTWLEIPASAFARKSGDEIRLSIPCNNRLMDAPYVNSLRNLTVANSRLGPVFRLSFG